MRYRSALVLASLLAGCSYSKASQRSESTLTVQDGNRPVRKITYSGNGDATAFTAGAAAVFGGVAPDGSYAGVNLGNGLMGNGVPGTVGGYAPGTAGGCVNPYACPTWVTTPVYNVGGPLSPMTAPYVAVPGAQPVASVTVGGSTTVTEPAPGAPSGSNRAALEQRVQQAENNIRGLAEVQKRELAAKKKEQP